MGRFSQRLFVSYTVFYIIGLLLSMQIPFVGFQPIRTSEHMAASGTLLNIHTLHLSFTFLYLQIRVVRRSCAKTLLCATEFTLCDEC